MDGCNLFQSIVHIVLPTTLPGIAAIFCFAFINIWNELFISVMIINKSSLYTIPVALNSFISKAGVSWDLMSAGIVVALLPTMIVFGIGQKYIVAGLTEGGVKG
jgi:multiple sugar transport system permease protein